MIIEIYHRRKTILKLNKIILSTAALTALFLGYNSVAADTYNNYQPHRSNNMDLTEEYNYNNQIELQERIKKLNIPFKEKLALLRKVKSRQDSYVLDTLRKEVENKNSEYSELEQEYQRISALIDAKFPQGKSSLAEKLHKELIWDLDGVKYDEGISKRTALKKLEGKINEYTKKYSYLF